MPGCMWIKSNTLIITIYIDNTKGTTPLGKRVRPLWAKGYYPFRQKGTTPFRRKVRTPLGKRVIPLWVKGTLPVLIREREGGGTIKAGEWPLCGNALRLLLCKAKLHEKDDICKFKYCHMLILHKNILYSLIAWFIKARQNNAGLSRMETLRFGTPSLQHAPQKWKIR